MTELLNQWLQQNMGRLASAIVARMPQPLLVAQDIADYLTVVGRNLAKTSEIVRANVQFWAITTIGYDARTAAEWLLALDIIKDELTIGLMRQFDAEDVLRYWRQMDAIFTFSYIEITHLASDLDRTELVAHQVQLRQQMGQLEQTKAQFVTIAAHELRTPLTIIEGYAKMMKSVTSAEDRIRLFIDGMGNGIRRMSEIIEDIIDVSMIDLDAYDLNVQEIRLDKLLLAVADNIVRSYQDRLVELVVMPMAEMPLFFGDEAKLHQAFVKLLENALKFTPEGGRVTLSTELVRMDEANDQIAGYVDVCISDTGIGIDTDDLGRIFEKFTSALDVNLHSSSKTNYMGGGPGLGLPIARGIVEMHGGRIWVESFGTQEKVYPGSSFHVELPLRLQPPQPQAEETE